MSFRSWLLRPVKSWLTQVIHIIKEPIMAALLDLNAAVVANTAAVNAAVAALGSIPAPGVPEADVAAAAATIAADAKRLADAVSPPVVEAPPAA